MIPTRRRHPILATSRSCASSPQRTTLIVASPCAAAASVPIQARRCFSALWMRLEPSRSIKRTPAVAEAMAACTAPRRATAGKSSASRAAATPSLNENTKAISSRTSAPMHVGIEIPLEEKVRRITAIVVRNAKMSSAAHVISRRSSRRRASSVIAAPAAGRGCGVVGHSRKVVCRRGVSFTGLRIPGNLGMQQCVCAKT